MPFPFAATSLDLPALEERVLTRWRQSDLMWRISGRRGKRGVWSFYEGPPTANGKPGVHHVWARGFKDLYMRFRTMQGYDVPRKGGWDCHGLPVELAVEKELGLSSKPDIERFGIAAFNDRCRESVQRYVDDWKALTERAGIWIDMEDAYWTLSNDYIESVWWIMRQLWERDLIYEGHRVVPYCARCGTALSSHELGQPDVYREVVDRSVFVRFPVVRGDARAMGADLLVWTTTPWTLVSNVAVASVPDAIYVRIPASVYGTTGNDLIVAEKLLPEGASDMIKATITGAELSGTHYERPFTVLNLDRGDERLAWTVVPGAFVNLEDGTGLVHIAPAFGEDDSMLAREAGLPTLNPVDEAGAFNSSVPEWQGQFVKKVDAAIVRSLSERQLLVLEQPYAHSYPHCWRCQTPLIYWAKQSWFVRTSAKRDVLLEENEKIKWHPSSIKHGRFGNWLADNVDWALSRDRYWGTPLPIWRCPDCRTDTCVGSLQELRTLVGSDLQNLDLHRPWIDNIHLECGNCGGKSRRVPAVLDAWFDSGAMPTAQHHYPFEGREAFEQTFPADFICEGIDQTRGWFYSLLAINSLVFGSSPYRNAVCLALVVDDAGRKMSKSRGNALDADDIFRELGADALRWFFFFQGQPWTPRRISMDAIRSASRDTLFTLWNVYSFFATYANIDGWPPGITDEEPPSHVLDRWILSQLDETVTSMTEALSCFDSFGAAARFAQFVEELSNWYVRRSRARFWKSGDTSAHATLYQCLVTSSVLLAPFCPFFADEVYVALKASESVHLAEWPAASGRHDPELARQMDSIRRLVALGRSARMEAGIKVRQPLGRAFLVHPGAELDPELTDELTDELNVKQLEHVESLSDVVSWTVVPNFRALGPRLGPKVSEIQKALRSTDGSVLKRALDEFGFLDIVGERLTAADLEARPVHRDGQAIATDGVWAVVLDLTITPALRSEGLARDLVRNVNEMRKRAGLSVTDRIQLALDLPPDFREQITPHLEWIAGEVLATELDFGPGETSFEVAGQRVRATISLVASLEGTY